jgi:PBP1b-binding outer membrane lipoprotein LpoB
LDEGNKVKKASLVLVIICCLLGCGPFKKNRRLEPQTAAEEKARSGESPAAQKGSKWNDAQAGLVAREMMADCLSKAWIPAYVGVTRAKPVVTVGTIHNRTGERIDTKALSSHLESELSRSGQVSFVPCKDECKKIGDQGLKQQEYISAEAVNRIKVETGANFVLVGAVSAVNDESEGGGSLYYQVTVELLNTKTMAAVWASTRKIKR